MAAPTRVKRVLRAPAKVLRRYLVPEYEDLLRNDRLAFESLEAAHGAIAHLQEQERIQRERGDVLQSRLEDAEKAVLEERRLNLRIAELTDVVTELVLPLHDREIDPEKLRHLAADTL